MRFYSVYKLVIKLYIFNFEFIGQVEAEVINCTTGKDELGKPSRISKQGLFKKFYNLLGKLDTIDDADQNQCRHYLEAKSSVQNYSVRNSNFIFQHFPFFLFLLFIEVN